ncbi:MAG: SRPBCC domain-containing protein [Candidatus Thorarchaeota archaeon]|nr:SRPBCC domain-containing protein [Candidatus Thorarchaeota archaeon]
MATISAKDTMPVIRLTTRVFRPVPEVWEKLVDPLVMLQWLGNEISAEIREGGTIRFLGENAPTTGEIGDTWTIKRVRKNQALLCSWPILGAETLFLMKMTPIAPGTHLEVRHGAIPVSAEPFHLPEHWMNLLANFRSVLELGEPALRFNYRNYHPLRVTRYDSTDVRLSLLCRTPPSIPYDVFTNPDKLRHFIRAEKPIVDRRYGGIYTWWAEGKGPVVFTKLVPDKEIEFSWAYGDEPETRVNIRFEQVEQSTLVSLHHYGFKDPERVVPYEIGWSSILSQLKLVCELGESAISVEYGGTI